ncbi:2' cyclic ADP-D-ribose synthase AbTIR-like isoform X2 [Corticium candelabrum]|uniref:2' cyclic ADP-D-ribose synthase AbTIR-like isoform X2 n=1 Tax=Corticium candelabrum TaxID=121492 RepID=UPI002E267303|nr:2' cyclic ADP-D-ribose synthase AbTIR-like isoform X2 [Corticium candelabrum]
MAEGIDPSWEKLLKPFKLRVAKQLCPRRHHLVTLLSSKGLLTEDEEEQFNKSTKSETDLALDVLAVLCKQISGSFDRFCDVLLDTKDKALCDVEKLLRPHCLERTKGVSSDQAGSSGVNSTAVVTDTTDGNSKPLSPFLASQGWKYDVFLCHAGQDKEGFARPLNNKLEEYGIVSFLDAVALKVGREAQKEIAAAIIRSPLFVVILSHEFKGKPYPEAEVNAAFEFGSRYKKIIPVFYKITADDCNSSTVTILDKLAQIVGIEKKTDENDDIFVTRVASTIRECVTAQLDKGEIEELPEISSVRDVVQEILKKVFGST